MGFLGNLFGKKSDSVWQASNGELVSFKRKYTKPAIIGNSVNTYEEWTAPSEQVAKEFLASRDVAEQQYYLAVETPEGNWCKDRWGVYQD